MRTKKVLLKTKFGELTSFNYRPDFNFFEVNQIHGPKIISIQQCSSQNKLVDADGIFATVKDIPIGPMAIKTADCLPIFILGEKGVALIHAGWRGLNQKILNNTHIEEIIPISAYLGPAICVDCYEVSGEFKEYFSEPSSFKMVGQKLHFSVKVEATRQLTRAFPNIAVSDSSDCTKCLAELHSFRENKTTERNYTIFIPKNS